MGKCKWEMVLCNDFFLGKKGGYAFTYHLTKPYHLKQKLQCIEIIIELNCDFFLIIL